MMILIVVCSLMLWGIVGDVRAVHAGTFQWTDENGTAGFTDNVLAVPRQHRKNVVKRQIRTPARSVTVRPQVKAAHSDSQDDATPPETLPSAQPVEGEIVDGGEPISERERWRARLQTAKAKIIELRAERGDLEHKIDESRRGRWFTFGPGASDLEKQEEVPKLEQNMRNLDQEIKQLEDEVKVVIPREARRAGIPPGWFR